MGGWRREEEMHLIITNPWFSPNVRRNDTLGCECRSICCWLALNEILPQLPSLGGGIITQPPCGIPC